MTSEQRTALLVVSLSSLIMPMMLSSVNVAIPTIAVFFNADAILVSWVSSAYLLTAAVFLLPFGKISDMLGRKKIYFAGMLTVILASILASLSPDIYSLIAARVLQGIGAAMLFGTGVAILTSVFPPDKRGKALGINVSAIYFGLTCGPLFGGWMTQHYSWRSVFIIHIPIAIFVILLARLKLEGEWKGKPGQKLDLKGAFIYALTIITLMLGLSNLPEWESLPLLLASITLLWIFVSFEKKISNPIFDVRVFQGNRTFSYSCLAAIALYTCTFALTFLMSLYLQSIKGLSPQVAGVIMICQPLIMAILSPFTGRLSDKVEPRYLTSAGMTLISTGLTMMVFLHTQSSIVYVLCCLAFTGLGFALFASPNTNAIMSSVDKQYLGVASSTVSSTRVLGQMFSMAVVTMAFAVIMGPRAISPENYPLLMRSIQVSFMTAACLSAFGIYLSLARGNIRT